MKGRTFTRLMITYASCFVILIAIALSSYVVAYDIYEDMCLDGNAEAMANGLDVMADEWNAFHYWYRSNAHCPTLRAFRSWHIRLSRVSCCGWNLRAHALRCRLKAWL